jgi:hypothetical protein
MIEKLGGLVLPEGQKKNLLLKAICSRFEQKMIVSPDTIIHIWTENELMFSQAAVWFMYLTSLRKQGLNLSFPIKIQSPPLILSLLLFLLLFC